MTLVVEKISYICSCGAVLRRKKSEPKPRSCNYCHTDNPEFTKSATFQAKGTKR